MKRLDQRAHTQK